MSSATLRIAVVGLGIALTVLLETAALAQKRVALVIGNTNYRHVARLANAANDATAIADLFRHAGFDPVKLHYDLGVAETRRVVRDFATVARNADVAAVFFAGHGIEVDGVNYLIPVDARIPTAFDVKDETIALDRLLESIEPARRLRLVILDACRDNPFVPRMARRGAGRSIGRGLGRVDRTVSNTLVAFAAQPGLIANDGTGAHSPFTAALLQHLATPGLEVRLAFGKVRDAVLAATADQQEPYLHISLGGDEIYLVPGATSAPPREPPPKGGIRRRAGKLSTPEERSVGHGDSFKECDVCPEMTVVKAGSFTMGSPPAEKWRNATEGPQRQVTFAQQFAVGRFAVTFDEWDACVTGGGCKDYRPSDAGWGRGRRPVINVSWDDAREYVAWLSRRTGKPYRLLSEAEREYVTRAGTDTPFWWGTSISAEKANYDGRYVFDGEPKGQYRGKTVPVETFSPNPWGFYQTHGNVREWVEDCYVDTYQGAPADGSARSGIECSFRVVRSGSWYESPGYLRSSSRFAFRPDLRHPTIGLRVARTLTP